MFETVHNRNLPPIMSLELPLLNESTESVHELRERFFASEYGTYMYDQTLRYAGRYGYDRERMLSDLGQDVCPVGHQYELPIHLQAVLDHEQDAGTPLPLTEREQAILAFTCSIHDIGECEHPDLIEAGLNLVGDIPAGMKSPLDRENEAAVRRFFYQKFYADVDPSILIQVEAIIAHKDTSLLHDLFEAAHELQTLDTVERAKASLETLQSSEGFVPEQLTALTGLVNGVPKFHAKRLEDFGHFGALRRMLG